MTPATVPQGLAVYSAISAITALAAKEGLGKTRKNLQQGYAFRGVDDAMIFLAPKLAEHQLTVIPRMISRSCEARVTGKGGTMYSVTVEAEFLFVSAVDGSREIARTFGEAMDSGDKATNKAMSAAFKYAAFQTFCIPTEGTGDEDADAVTPPATRPAPQKPPAQTALRSVEDGRSRARTTKTFEEQQAEERERAKANYAAPAKQAAPAAPPSGGDDDDTFPGDRPSKLPPSGGAKASKSAPKGPVQHVKPDPAKVRADEIKRRSNAAADRLVLGDQNTWGLRQMMGHLNSNPNDPNALAEVQTRYEEWKRIAGLLREAITDPEDKERLNEGRQILRDAMDLHMNPEGEFTTTPGLSEDDAAEEFLSKAKELWPDGKVTVRDHATR